ncbi:hypothetical protein FRC10_005093, partial [Ceratobasidium sp. 414]
RHDGERPGPERCDHGHSPNKQSFLPSPTTPPTDFLYIRNMSLIHALVARSSIILAENRTGKRDFSNAVSTILSKIPPNNSKLTYVWEQYLFHYVSEDGLTFLVMADDAAGRRMPFTFLADLQRRFTTAYPRDQIDDVPAYGLNEFSPQIGRYNTSPPADALNQAQQDLAQVKDIMVHNVEQILSRGERIGLLVDKTSDDRNQRILALSVFVGLVSISPIQPG